MFWSKYRDLMGRFEDDLKLFEGMISNLLKERVGTGQTGLFKEEVKPPRNNDAQAVMAESRALIARKLADGVYQKEIAKFLGVGKSTLSEFIKAEGLLEAPND
jgi:DNA invertase Pin-like site-specific DNA recombinase